MFTGIITDLGKLIKKENSLFIFEADEQFCKKIDRGTSVAINGTCLTVINTPDNTNFSVEIMLETQKRTMINKLSIGNLVNLELPATAQTFLSGHIVQGHVDGIGIVYSINQDGNSKILTIHIPKKLSTFIIEKGSIAVNGISLTVIKSAPLYFTVGIIPFTWKHTMLYTIKIGEPVNIEADVMAKYIDKLLYKTRKSYEKTN